MSSSYVVYLLFDCLCAIMTVNVDMLQMKDDVRLKRVQITFAITRSFNYIAILVVGSLSEQVHEQCRRVRYIYLYVTSN